MKYGFALFPLLMSLPAWSSEQRPPDLDFVSVLSVLVFVLLLIVGLAWLFHQTKFSRYFGQNGIKVVATTPLGRKEKLMVVQLGEQQYLLAATAQQINLIDKLEQPLAEPTEPPVPLAGAFAEQLAKVIKKDEKNQ
ncbi:flagellar biosynthetic protein FliO [Motilimonas eburnea]|uniref:flagellar biosynthetic protein FliO n=1 Tax=Motilimonas eburnea TaxID=1737488 RepID=UPI001E4AADAF|nr:flagellar biosynthetic protein FliO [Motilimonas eburnea]MCE2571507.1 flagellar biosynthetic protein FliO [Motilimonas eburnea]